ncbi:MAG: enolase C-terminal domain-like protein, partial [Caldimonas sp.]
TEEGVVGHAYLFCYLDAAGPAALSMLQDAATMLAGRSAAPADVRRTLDSRFRLIGARGLVSMVMAGIDIACWDALALQAGLPLARLLGAPLRPIPAYNSNGLGLVEPAAAVDEALELADEGFGAIKMRLGRPRAEDDLAALRAVRKALPSHVALMVDYNQALGANDARERCRPLDDEGLAWIEEPIRHDDYAGSAGLAALLHTPVQIGENFAGPRAMAQALAAAASDLVMPDLERIGGVSGWIAAAALADAAGIPMSSHLFGEVSVHLLAASPTAHWLEAVDWADPILQEPLRVADGFMTPPDRPGNGLSWDVGAVERYRVV